VIVGLDEYDVMRLAVYDKPTALDLTVIANLAVVDTMPTTIRALDAVQDLGDAAAADPRLVDDRLLTWDAWVLADHAVYVIYVDCHLVSAATGRDGLARCKDCLT